MGKRQLGLLFVFSLIVSLGLVSFVSCIFAETKRVKTHDLTLDGKLCFLPGSHAAVFGVTALICLSLAELIGNLLFCVKCCCSRGKAKANNKLIIPVTLLLFSWICFGIAVILIGIATSMSRVQRYGEGWVDGECYTVRDGVYVGAGAFGMVIVLALIGAVATATEKDQGDGDQKVHAQNA
ncbi:hypothetical protein SLE2022_092590 [Rubroshorea leprosula]